MLCLTIGTLIAYGSVFISPDAFKYSAGISVLIPVFLGLNFFTLLYYLFKGSFASLLPMVLLVLGYPFMQVSLAFNSLETTEGDLSVMSYNVKRFVGEKSGYALQVHDFVLDEAPDILCLQEFNVRNRDFRDFAKKGKYRMLGDPGNHSLAMFTKYPVIDHGKLFEGATTNNILYADLLIKKDTIRVYNVHLQSMGINTSRLQDSEGIREGYEEAKTKFLDGAAVRARQISVLMDHLEGCTHPIIIAGDFNDVPYSYNHFKVRRGFTNAFEAAGSGFGITYNGKLPFLRIDHQFYRGGIEASSFKTFDHVVPSDHFPILGIYTLSD